ncbi:hypothetical protein F444_17830 [Plasmopara halstedii]|uniref:MutL C-terminal dimerisation domain-containing protein n=1 Tax=Plasmopara halstedii TaxID=4781 RepID=A0A0P1ASU0_PLAHL|nr:hypothetical protein F444_17830 [Plasmopara halstedii]CEG44334.1 hypothetical protein F444_17830 [Plasmopara halstedii]|eukprot:XP_024580703.1 hypothetical protein F444_17830 [Plasmopara halstedii]
MALNVLNDETCDLINASYAIPNLETAVMEVIYNSIDAQAKKITVIVDVETASFTVVDDGDGIQPDDLLTYIGESYASSRVTQLSPTRHVKRPPKYYGCRGAFLRELTALGAEVEVESRVKTHWTSYRKIFKEGNVVLKARSEQQCEAPGTKVVVSNLFWKLPVRQKDLNNNEKHRARVIQNINTFCVNMSMIWPSLSFYSRNKDNDVRPVTIPAVNSCRVRFMKYFGQFLGNELQYVDFTSKIAPYSIRGYIAFIPGELGVLGQGIKQAKSYYQFAYIENKPVVECHRLCSRVITEAALQIVSSIPIFVLKIAALIGSYDIFRIGQNKDILFKSPEQFHQFLYEFVGTFAATDFNRTPDQKCTSTIEEEICSEKYHGAVDWVEKQAVPNHFYHPKGSLSAPQKLSSKMSRPQKMIFWVDEVDSGYSSENEQWTSEFAQRPSAKQCCMDDSSVKPTSRCHNYSERSNNGMVETAEKQHGTTGKEGSLDFEATGFEPSDFAIHCQALDRTEFGNPEHLLEDIFFSYRPCSSLLPHAPAENKISGRPWLSSKPDAFDCADVFLDLCQDYSSNIVKDSDEDKSADFYKKNWLLVSDENQICQRPTSRPTAEISDLPSSNYKSKYFDIERSTNDNVRRWDKSKMASFDRFASALRIENTGVSSGDQSIKISKSVLENMQVIRQIDRKFILVQVDTQRGKLVLCIDQHAADERVRLETLEKEMFGQDGTLRRVETGDHKPPIALRMNHIEYETLCHHARLIRSWGFEFNSVALKPKPCFQVREKPETSGTVCVLLYRTPKVDGRLTEGGDFRDYIQLLSNASEAYQFSRIRPPVITRLLHSRACRSAIMFGDHLSLGQCKELIEDLKTCQLPFQCAHGRPSIVPLADIHDGVSSC